ncbi:MAG: mandelate racemase/muconate lactonizing enzyme family protein [Hyphomicrobiales bacterium]|nr:mandelate racemase/muconate lactonizing enzyme family protein [Hyphomicrobiales bacterium]
MHLGNLEIFTVGNPEPGRGGRYFLLVKATSACGVTGVGEAYAANVGPEAMERVIRDVFDRYFLDESPFQIESLFRRVYGSGFSQRPDATTMGAFSALEMCCWDIVGKALDKPVYMLLGGKVRDRLRCYTYLYPDDKQDAEKFYADAQMSAERAAELVEEGFNAVKFDPAGAYSAFGPDQPAPAVLERCEQFMALIREAVEERADLLFGTHGQFTPSGALRLARRLEPFEPLWFEEPVPPDMPEAMAKVAANTDIPIAAGERLTTKYEFARLLSCNAASILQPDLGRSGGILEGKKIAALAEVHHAQIAPHLYCGPVVAAANIQLATCIPNFLILESIGKMDGFHGKLLRKGFRWEEGCIIPPDSPGLGIELNEEVARAHPYDGKGLHLEMLREPVDFDHAQPADGAR